MFQRYISMANLNESGETYYIYHFIELREYDDYEVALLLYLPSCFYSNIEESKTHQHNLNC